MREEQKGVQVDKTRITCALTTNANGTEKRENLIIGRSARPASFGRKSSERFGFYYESNKNRLDDRCDIHSAEQALG